MAARKVQPEGWQEPKGYSNGMTGQGRFLAVAGQIGWDASGTLQMGFLAQWEQALANVATVVRTAGGTLEDILSLTIYVVDKREYLADSKGVGQAYRKVMGRHFPAMALVQVSALVEDDARVEIQAMAALPMGGA